MIVNRYECTFPADKAVETLPHLPLKLIHALSIRQEASGDLDIRLPSPSQLDDLSPLPLSLPVLLCSGTLSVPTGSPMLDCIETYRSSTSGTTHITLDTKTHAALLAESVKVCQTIRKTAAMEGVSYLDIQLAFQQLEADEQKQGKKMLLTVSDT